MYKRQGVEVPGSDGRAGMAAITLAENVNEIDIDGLNEYLRDSLPSYAVPVFLRIQNVIDLTGTFKMKKGGLREESNDIRLFHDPVYVLIRGQEKYQRLHIDLLESIESGEISF